MFGFFKKALGVGGARVEVHVENARLVPGETLVAQVVIFGGDRDSSFRGVDVELVTLGPVEARSGETHHAQIHIDGIRLDGGEIAAGDEIAAQVEIDLAPTVPLSVGATHPVLRARLDVAGGRDPGHEVSVQIDPTPLQRRIFEAAGIIGFRLDASEVEHDPSRARMIPGAPEVMQEFDFKPKSLADFSIDEIEISFLPATDGVEVLLTVDSRGGIFRLDRERLCRFHVPEMASTDDIARELRAAIQNFR